MPGIFGAYQSESKQNINNLMENMLLSMNPDGGFRTDRYLDEGRKLCLGRVSLGIVNPFDQPVRNPEESIFLLFHGELYGKKKSLTDPEYVLEKYIKYGDGCASELNGIFHFAVYDKRLDQIKLFSDKFGLQPLYYSIFNTEIVFAGEVKAILEDVTIDKSPDYESIADFLHYGQILGEKTLFKNIKLLGPGSVLTYNLKNSEVSIKKYWRLDSLFVENGNYNFQTSVEQVTRLLAESITSRSMNSDILGISLSGGLDSRGILAGLGKQAEGIQSYTLGLAGCADQKLAEKMARISGTRHEFIELNQAYLQDFENMALSMIRLSDGMYHPHESTEMLAMEYFKSAGFKVLLRGHGGEIAKAALAYPVMATPEINSYSSSREILSFIFKITNLVIRDIDTAKLFTPFFRDVMRETPVQSLRKSCGKAAETLAPADVCIFYYISEHIRRQVIASLEIFRTRLEIRMPYVDEAYIKKLLELPVKFRNEGEIHFELIKRCMPELIKIPNSNTGAPLDAGPLRLLVTDKFNSLMKRFSVKGFRHYTEFQKWHRASFQENSKKIIFSEQSEYRKLYDMDYLKTIFELHISGKRDYGHLLGTIVGLELWYRSFVD